MSEFVISLDEALALRDRGALLVDARSPSEFAEGSIPGAINVPLFDDAERAQVGTIYKQQGKSVARKLGVKLVGPKIPELMDAVQAALESRRPPVVVFCWRGGLRSHSLTTFLNLAGIPARQLQGGHKAFRHQVVEFLEQGAWGRLLVLRGLTGVGKTRLLLQLAEEGYPVLDLEGLANHRGSAFGGLGLPPQPSQKTFEALLWDELRRIPADGYALAEGESKRIGRLVLPARVYSGLQLETSLWLNASLEHRVQVTLQDYPALDNLKAAFIPPICALRPRLGGEAVERLLELLDAGAWEALVRELMVLYYDPLYNHTKPERRLEIDLEPEAAGLLRLKIAIREVLEQAPVGAAMEQPFTCEPSLADNGRMTQRMSYRAGDAVKQVEPEKKVNKLCGRCLRQCRQPESAVLVDCPRFLPRPFKVAIHRFDQLDLFAEEPRKR